MTEPTAAKVVVPGTISVTGGVGFSIAQLNDYLQAGALLFAIISGIITAYRFHHWWKYERKK